MGKIIRLTESDLVKLVQRVISEQTKPAAQKTSPTNSLYDGFTKLPKSIRIKADMGVAAPMMIDISHKWSGSFGCQFIGVMRGTTALYFKFAFDCNKQTLVIDESYSRDFPRGQRVKISSEALDLLIDSCGCDKYVKNSSQSTTDFV